MSDPANLLAGLPVLEIGTGVAVAHCGKLLAEAGARVEKLLSPDDPILLDGPFAGTISLLALDLNQGKTIREINDGDWESSLAGKVVVIIGSLPGSPVAAQIFERCGGDGGGRVVAILPPFGNDGPWSNDSGTDITAMAAGGFLHMIGEQARSPLTLGGYQADRSQGASAFTGVMVALFAQAANGRGQLVEASAVDTIAYMEWKADIYEQADGKPRRRGEKSQWFDLACADGPFSFIYENPDWPKIKALISDPRLDDPRFQERSGRIEHHDALAVVLQDWIGNKSKAEAYAEVQAAGIPAGMVADTSDVLASPQYEASGFFVDDCDETLGRFRRPGAAWSIDGIRPQRAGADI